MKIENIILPSLGEGISEGTVITVFVKKGDSVDEQQGIIEVETDKVALEVPVDFSGIVEEMLVEVGSVIKVGETIARIKVATKTDEQSAITEIKEDVITTEVVTKKVIETAVIEEVKPVISTATSVEIPKNAKQFRTSPLARKFARELGVDINAIDYEGSRITVQIVKDFVKAKNQNSTNGVAAGNSIIQKPLPDFSKWGSFNNEKLSAIGKATLNNMNYSWATIPHAWISEKVDITDIEAARQRHKVQVKQDGGSLTITSILVKACTIALKKHPIFNSSLNASTQEIIYKNYFNISVAVDTDRGLMVPVIKNTDGKSITEISKDLAIVSQKAKTKKTTMDDLEGATFTISNLGGIGSTSIMPIVNAPEVGILGVSASTLEPKWNGTEFKPRLTMPITIAFDHRVINGADALRFLITIKGLLEDPFLMSL